MECARHGNFLEVAHAALFANNFVGKCQVWQCLRVKGLSTRSHAMGILSTGFNRLPGGGEQLNHYVSVFAITMICNNPGHSRKADVANSFFTFYSFLLFIYYNYC